MEGANVECVSQCRFGLAPQVPQGEFADLVGKRLAGPGNVAVDLGADLVHRQGRVRRQVVDGLLPRPALRMDAGIDDQPAGAPHLVGKTAEVIVRRIVHAHLDAELFGVQAPAFAIGMRIELLPEPRRILDLVGQCALQMMAGNAFV